MNCDDLAEFLLSIGYDKAVACKVKENKFNGSFIFSYLSNDKMLDELLRTTDKLQRSKFRCLFKRQLLQKDTPMARISIEQVVKLCESIPLLQQSAKVWSYNSNFAFTTY